MNISTQLASVTLGACLGFLGAGCAFDAGLDSSDVVIESSPDLAILPIDPDAVMSLSPGDGAGFFVEYASGGHWDVFTTCDTSTSGASCNFDAVISADPDVALSGVEGTNLGSGDSVLLQSDGSVRLVTDTSFGTNGLHFDAEPGATIEFDVLLDGEPQPRFVYAVSDGALLEGVPSNPVDFSPASP